MSDDEQNSSSSSSSKKRIDGPISPISTPMAGKKLHKRLYKVVKKGK